MPHVTALHSRPLTFLLALVLCMRVPSTIGHAPRKASATSNHRETRATGPLKGFFSEMSQVLASQQTTDNIAPLQATSASSASSTGDEVGGGEDETLGLPDSLKHDYEHLHPARKGGAAAFDQVPSDKWNAPVRGQASEGLPEDYQASTYGGRIPASAAQGSREVEATAHKRSPNCQGNDPLDPNACIHAPSHRVLRQALINLASREVNQTAVILHALEVVEDAILATWQGSQVTRLNVTVNSTDVLLQRVQQARADIVAAIDNSTASIKNHANSTATAQLLLFDQGRRAILSSLANDTATLIDALMDSSNHTTTEVTRQLNLATVDVTGAISGAEASLLGGLSTTRQSVSAALSATQADLLSNLDSLSAALSGVLGNTQTSLGQRVDLFNSNVLASLNGTLQALTAALSATNTAVASELNTTTHSITSTTTGAAAILSQNVTSLLSTLSSLTSAQAGSVSERVDNSTAALQVLLGGVRTDLLSQVANVTTQVNTLISDVKSLAGSLTTLSTTTCPSSTRNSSRPRLTNPPGIEYMGAGYDLLFGSPRGDGTASRDPGFRAQILRFRNDQGSVCPDGRYLCPKGVWLRQTAGCSTSDRSTQIESYRDYQFSFDGDVSMTYYKSLVPMIVKMRASGSVHYGRFSKDTRRDRTTTFENKVYCRTQTAQLQPNTEYELTPEFQAAVAELAKLNGSYDYPAYKAFIQDWGTSYTHWVEYGGRLTVEVDFTQSDVSNFVRDEIDVAGSVSVGVLTDVAKASVGFSSKTKIAEGSKVASAAKSTRIYTVGGFPVFNGGEGGNLASWAASVPSRPAPIRYKLKWIWQLFTDITMRDNMERAIDEYAVDPSISPSVVPSSPGFIDGLYGGEKFYRAGCVEDTGEALGAAPVSYYFYLRLSGEKDPAPDTANYTVFYDTPVPYVATVATPLYQDPYTVSDPPALLNPTESLLHYYTGTQLAAISNSGFNVRTGLMMTGYNEERWAFVNTPYSFISAASTFNLTTGRGLISGAVRGSGRRYNLDHIRDQYFSAWLDRLTKGTAKSSKLGVGKPRKFAIKFRKVENSSRPVIVVSPFRNRYNQYPLPGYEIRLMPFVFKQNDPECYDCTRPDQTMHSVYVFRGATRSLEWDGTNVEDWPLQSFDPLATYWGATRVPFTDAIVSPGISFIALSGAGYSGPNNEIVWGSVKWQHHNTYCGNAIAGVANETTTDYLDFFVNEMKSAAGFDGPKIFFSTTEDALIKTNGCGTVQVDNAGSGDWDPVIRYTQTDYVTKADGKTRTYTRFLGVQIKLKKGALRYTDVPGVAVTPVLGGERDLAGQMGTQCTASFKPDLEGVETQGIVVVCWSRLANPWYPYDVIRKDATQMNSEHPKQNFEYVGGSPVPLDFNFVIMGAREPAQG